MNKMKDDLSRGDYVEFRYLNGRNVRICPRVDR